MYTIALHMVSIIAKEWFDAPIEICNHVLSFIHLMPKIRQEFVLPHDASHADVIELIDKDTFITAFRRCEIWNTICGLYGNGYQLPEPIDCCDVVFVNDGKIFIRAKYDKHIAYIISKSKTTKIDVGSAIRYFGYNDGDMYAVTDDDTVVLPVPYVIPCDEIYSGYVITCEDYTVSAPWIVASILDNTIAYITVKEIDGIPQKIAVLADL